MQALFTFLQMHFLFVNSEVIVEKFGQIARFGFMHLVATNLALWVRMVVWESANDSMTLLDERSTYDIGLSKIGTTCPRISFFRIAKTEQVLSQQQHIGRALINSQQYLFPFIIQYSLIAASVTYIMWCNVGKERLRKLGNSCKAISESSIEKRSKGHWKVDCRSSSKGLFLGLLVLVGGIVILIIFFVMKNQNDFRENLFWMSNGTMMIIFSLSIIATIFGFIQIPKLSVTTTQPLDLDRLLLSVTVIGVYIFSIFGMIVGGIEYNNSEKLATFCSNTLLLIQVSLQGMLVAEASRRTCSNRFQMVSKPGRQVITFLLFSNITLWILDTFMTHNSITHQFQIDFYGKVVWGDRPPTTREDKSAEAYCCQSNIYSSSSFCSSCPYCNVICSCTSTYSAKYHETKDKNSELSSSLTRPVKTCCIKYVPNEIKNNTEHFEEITQSTFPRNTQTKRDSPHMEILSPLSSEATGKRSKSSSSIERKRRRMLHGSVSDKRNNIPRIFAGRNRIQKKHINLSKSSCIHTSRFTSSCRLCNLIKVTDYDSPQYFSSRKKAKRDISKSVKTNPKEISKPAKDDDENSSDSWRTNQSYPIREIDKECDTCSEVDSLNKFDSSWNAVINSNRKPPKHILPLPCDLILKKRTPSKSNNELKLSSTQNECSNILGTEAPPLGLNWLEVSHTKNNLVNKGATSLAGTRNLRKAPWFRNLHFLPK
ncbi:Otopetrin-1 [Armadillidium nasatum]|uniref:Otopetrin-1 n=1 Tax=Armadillidium nasatum TaxID=96803 RepID=A0A5N5TM46_9CRUS|nr:Otopetrin-1 [Armadillidium nasatum]